MLGSSSKKSSDKRNETATLIRSSSTSESRSVRSVSRSSSTSKASAFKREKQQLHRMSMDFSMEPSSVQCNHCNGILCDITECCFYEKNNKDGRLEVHFILRPELLSRNTHSRCIQRSMMRQTMPQAHLCRIECVENHIVRAKYKQHRVRSSESYLLARASTQPRGSEDQSACQSQRTVFIMCCRDLI